MLYLFLPAQTTAKIPSHLQGHWVILLSVDHLNFNIKRKPRFDKKKLSKYFGSFNGNI